MLLFFYLFPISFSFLLLFIFSLYYFWFLFSVFFLLFSTFDHTIRSFQPFFTYLGPHQCSTLPVIPHCLFDISLDTVSVVVLLFLTYSFVSTYGHAMTHDHHTAVRVGSSSNWSSVVFERLDLRLLVWSCLQLHVAEQGERLRTTVTNNIHICDVTGNPN